MLSAVFGLPEQKEHAHPDTFYVDPEQVMQVLSSQSEMEWKGQMLQPPPDGPVRRRTEGEHVLLFATIAKNPL